MAPALPRNRKRKALKAKDPKAPVIVLVRPQLPENIGAAARAMMNFGLQQLRLVSPVCAWPHPLAYRMSAGAEAILDATQLFTCTEDAVADLQHVYGTTARSRELSKPVETVNAAMQGDIAAWGVMFGPERTGLTNDDVMLCDRLVTIPTSDLHPSLNVAQSLVIVAYEWFRQQQATPPETEALLGSLATKAEMQGFFDHLEGLLDAADFFKTPQKKPKMWLNLRSLFLRAHPNSQEVRTLRGMIRGLAEISITSRR